MKITEKNKNNENYFLSNSNLSWLVKELIINHPVTLYIKDSEGKWTVESEYFLNSDENFDPLKFTESSDSDIYWRYDLSDILIFFENVWWDSILMLFNLYNLNVWGGRKNDVNTNKFSCEAGRYMFYSFWVVIAC